MAEHKQQQPGDGRSATEPAVSKARSTPNDRPARPAPASSATSESFGASFPPLPSLSTTRRLPTAATFGASASSGLEISEAT